MKTTQVTHYNLIQSHINTVLQDESPKTYREVYCKKLHKVWEPDAIECETCPYFGGLMGGYGHECVWEDVVAFYDDDEKVVRYEDRNAEMLRVSQLIDNGVLKKG